MPPFLNAFADGPAVAPGVVAIRLLASLVLGGLVAWVYRRTRSAAEVTPSFPTTLVLLSILIAMVTQVIGDNVARAFSLVGALSIVRFRTVVRDTQDTAYVIFAVVVGMAAGAADLWVAGIGIAVVALAAYLMMPRRLAPAGSTPAYILSVRLALGHDAKALLEPLLDRYTGPRQLQSIGTARQGMSIDVVYETRLKQDDVADELIKALNRVDGVQSVELKRRGPDDI